LRRRGTDFITMLEEPAQLDLIQALVTARSGGALSRDIGIVLFLVVPTVQILISGAADAVEL
jgi:hypothetical protein